MLLAAWRPLDHWDVVVSPSGPLRGLGGVLLAAWRPLDHLDDWLPAWRPHRVMIRVVLFMNGARGRAVLGRLLHEEDVEVAAVVTPPSYGEAVPVRHLALEDVNASIALLSGLEADVFLVAGFSSIFSEELLSLPPRGTINLHAGPLPGYRGGSPLNWQLINGEREAGISVVQMDAGIDSGDVLMSAVWEIGARDTIADLHERVNHIFPDLVMQALFGAPGQAQDELQARYWHQRNDADGQMDFARLEAAEADRFIRALTRPYPGAWAMLGGQRVRFFAAELPDPAVCGTPGRIVWIQGEGPWVVCSDRAILLTDWRVEGDGRLRHGMRFD